MFKKTLLAVGLALGLAGTASAGDIISNDVNQLDLGTTQLNLITELNAISVGNTVFDQTNALNASTVVLDNGVAGDVLFNDTNQLSAFNVQGNAILSLGIVNVGNTAIAQTNAVNVASVDIDAWDDVVGNDVRQLSAFNLQGNAVAIGELASLGNTTIAQTNVANSALVDIDVDSFDTGTFEGIEFAVGNDVLQISAISAQGNIAAIAEGISIGNLTVAQTNAMNLASVTITEAEVAAFNDVRQIAGTVIQGNGLFVAQGANLGNLDVDQINVANSASVTYVMEQDGLSAASLALGNDIFQDAETAGTVDQENIVQSLTGLGIGNTAIDQINAVNVATMDMSSNVGTLVAYVGNDITQLATGGLVDQDNTINLGSIIDVGNVDINQTNVVNSADMSLTGAAFALGNDVTQLATGLTQTNVTTMAALGSIGNVNVSQVNAINVSSLVITP